MGVGSGNPIFNRHKLSVTRFHQLDKVEQGSTTQPKVLVLQGRYGGTVGDLAPYDLATLGGPFSVSPCQIPAIQHDSMKRGAGWQPELFSNSLQCMLGAT